MTAPNAKKKTSFHARAAARALLALCGVLGLLPARAAHAEAPRFTAEVERNQVAAGEPFVFQVTLSVGNDQVSDYRPPDFKGLRVLAAPAAPNQSTQMQLGGAGMFVQVSYTWQYELAAPQKGSFTIGAARVRVSGQEFRSNPVPVTAIAAAAPAAPPPLSGAPGSPGDTPPGAAPGGPVAEAAEGGSFIRLVTDKKKVFAGEAIAAAWYLYMDQPVDKYDTQTEPHTEGFWTEDVTVPSRRGGLVLTQETVQGRPYQVAMVLKKALFPLQLGRLTITPMEAEISRSDFFGNAVRSQRVRSAPSAIEVLPLPKLGQPAGFDAANVGTFTLNARVDRTEVAVGEPVTLTVEVGGHGNLRKLAMPAIPRIEGWKSYEPRVNVVVDPASGVSGTKTAEILLMPERPGAVTLPALVLNTFDPDSQRYARVETAPLTLTATGDAVVAGARAGAPAAGAGTGVAGGGGPGLGAAGPFSENVLSEEIRPLHGRVALRRDLGTTFFRTRGFAAALALPPFGLAVAVMMFRIRERLAEDSGSRRRRRSRKKVRAHLAAADGYRQRGEVGLFFIEIDRVMREALTSRLGRSVKGLRMDELRELLLARGLAAPQVDRVVGLLETCDQARFAPSPASGGGDPASTLGSILDTASELIDVIERASLADEAGA